MNSADGTELGHIDLRSETVVSLAPEYAEAMGHCADRWLQPAAPEHAPSGHDVGDELAKLCGDWRVMRTVSVGHRGTAIDHLAIGPPGVFTMTTKLHPGARAWIGDHAIKINGQRTNYVRTSRLDAQRASRVLSRACGFAVPVRAAIVFVGLDDFTLAQPPADVDVTTRRRMGVWLAGLPVANSANHIEAIHAAARRSTIWR